MDYLQYLMLKKEAERRMDSVLNLIINGLPSIPFNDNPDEDGANAVLNLIINGLPSIPLSSYIF